MMSGAATQANNDTAKPSAQSTSRLNQSIPSPSIPNPVNPVIPSIPQAIWNALSFKDIFGLLGVGLSSAFFGVFQAFALSIFLMIGWFVQDSFIGQVLIPGLWDVAVGITAALLPVSIAMHAQAILIGTFGGLFALNLVKLMLTSAFAPEKPQQRNQVKHTSTWDVLYHLGAWVVPIAVFCIGFSTTPIWDNLFTACMISGLAGAGFCLVEKSQEYLQQLMMRVQQNMMQQQPTDRGDVTTNTPRLQPQVQPATQKPITPQFQQHKKSAKPVDQADKASPKKKADKPKNAGTEAQKQPLRKSSRISKRRKP